MTRTSRIRTAWLAIAMLLFAQLAVSAFACDMPAAPAAMEMTDCGDAGMDGAPLCQKHCNPEAQSQAPLAFVALPFVPAFIVAADAPCALLPAAGAPPRELLHATSPPIPISYCRLRD